MDFSRLGLRGVWLPLITPFCNDEVDAASLRHLVKHYLSMSINGLILCATSGEGGALSPEETEKVVDLAIAEREDNESTIPVYLGLSGSATHKVAAELERTKGWPLDGYLVTCPPYNRPSQNGLFAHFSALADATERPILIYNIPYRTGINMTNDTMFRLAEHENIVGVKDCCSDAGQTYELLRDRPSDFTVFTGEDALFYSSLAQGGDGGILVCAHVLPEVFAAIWQKLTDGDRSGALEDWHRLSHVARLLFAEPNPAATKYWLWRAGLIISPEMRLPMMPVSKVLARQIDEEMAKWKIKSAA